MEPTSDLLALNVRGFTFQIETRLLEKNTSSKLYGIYKHKHDSNGTRALYFNRDPFVFSSIVDYYSTGEFHLNGQCASKIKDELEFWGLSPEIMCLSCNKEYREMINDTEDLHELVRKWSGDGVAKSGPGTEACSDGKWRQRLWDFLESDNLSTSGKIYAAFVTFVNLFSVLVISVSTTPALRTFLSPNVTDPYDHDHVIDMLNQSELPESVYVMDCVMIGVLMIDLVLRFVAAPSKRGFFSSFINVAGLLSVLPALFIYVAIGLGQYSSISLRAILGDAYEYILLALFILEGFRVVYALRIAKYYEPMKVILLAMRESRSELFLLTSCLLMGATLFGHILYAIEMYRDSFWSIPDAIWWAVITMTTVGYGDAVPVTVQGKIVGTFCALTGILLLALPVPVIANNFIRVYNVAKMLRSRKANSRKTS